MPGAVIGFGRLSRMNGQARAFALFSLTLIAAFLAEAAVYGANSTFLYERFAFYCTPLLVIAFVVWFESGETLAPPAVCGCGVRRWGRCVALATHGNVRRQHLAQPNPGCAEEPRSRSRRLGSGRVVPDPRRPGDRDGMVSTTPRRALLITALAVSGLMTVGAVARSSTEPHTASTPHVSVSDGAAFLTTSSADLNFLERTLFWSPSITRVLVFAGGGAPDGYGADDVTLTPAADLATASGTNNPGLYVVDPSTEVWTSSPVERRPDGIEVVKSDPKAIVFG